jgi:Ferredoxin-like domain in Api92-like protein
MPNWCSNRLQVSTINSGKEAANQLTAFMLAAKGKDSDISFNNLYPTPESLSEVSSGSDEIAYDVLYGDWLKIASYGWVPGEAKGSREDLFRFIQSRDPNKDFRAIADKYKHNLDTYGFRSWYDWNVGNWGTKWDMDGSGGRAGEILEYHFQTANSPPVEGLRKISQDFPLLYFVLEYFEGGMGFCGMAEIHQGEFEDDYREFQDNDDLKVIAEDDSIPFARDEASVRLEMEEE